MSVVGDVFLLTLRSIFKGEVMLNTFTCYQRTPGDTTDVSGSEFLTRGFMQDILPSLSAVQATGVTYLEIETINLFNDDDLYSTTTITPASGTVVSAETMPTWFALEWTTNRATRAIKRGFKRFSGINAAWIANGSLDVAYNAQVNALATAMGADIVWSGDPDSPTFITVIVKRIKYTTDKDTTAYRLPENSGEYQGFEPDWFYNRVTTQNSRKSF